jgi:6,7-dimethyl-8-ribityllumazine synthase
MANSKNSISLTDETGLHGDEPYRIAVLQTEWNENIVRELLNGCDAAVHRNGGQVLSRHKVPGCFELPYACRALWKHYESAMVRPDAIVVFGAVIRGGTPHFDYVCKAVTEGILQLNLELPVPIIFGVLTLDNEEQAWERLGGIHGHKGEEAGIAALKMARLCRTLATGEKGS